MQFKLGADFNKNQYETNAHFRPIFVWRGDGNEEFFDDDF